MVNTAAQMTGAKLRLEQSEEKWHISSELLKTLTQS